jgi:hypothetical protein
MTQATSVVLGKQSGFITQGGQFIPASIPHMGECNTLATEMRLYCQPCGDAGRIHWCYVARWHRVVSACPYWDGITEYDPEADKYRMENGAWIRIEEMSDGS